MRALICDDFGGLDQLRLGSLPPPVPGPGSALIRVHAATVNFADTLLVAGRYQMRPPTPFAPGSEVAGVVVEAGPSAGVEPGDRVCAYVGHGGMAELAVSHPASLTRLPDLVSFAEGAAVPVAYGTSYHALVDRGRVQPGETLMVLGAAGGVGLAAVQIGRVLGLKVIAVVSTAEKETAVRDAGADEVIRSDLVDLRHGVEQATDGAGVDVVLDPVGGAATEAALRDTRWNGRLLVVGFASGEIPSIPLNLTLVKGNSVVGVFWGRFLDEEPERNRHNERVIMDWVGAGSLRPYVQRRYPLNEAVEALRWVGGRRVVGRVVVEP